MEKGERETMEGKMCQMNNREVGKMRAGMKSNKPENLKEVSVQRERQNYKRKVGMKIEGIGNGNNEDN